MLMEEEKWTGRNTKMLKSNNNNKYQKNGGELQINKFSELLKL